MKHPTEKTATTKFTKVSMGNASKPKISHMWTCEGIKYYNERMKAIIDERKQSNDFDFNFIKSLKIEKKRKADKVETNKVVPLIDPSLKDLIM